MLCRAAADGVVVLHLLFIAYAVFGGLLLLRRRAWALLHLPAAAWAAAIELRGWTCPLTPLENWLRRQGGRGAYAEGFVEHYLLPLVYPPGMTREVQVFLGAAVVAVNAGLYLWAFSRAEKVRPGEGKAEVKRPSGGP